MGSMQDRLKEKANEMATRAGEAAKSAAKAKYTAGAYSCGFST